MKLFLNKFQKLFIGENKKLKVSGKRIVKDRKQAVAIGLNTAERK